MGGAHLRADDIVVTTSYKSGTTWTQTILLHVLYGDEEELPERRDVFMSLFNHYWNYTDLMMRS
jgi:hypothetical protein